MSSTSHAEYGVAGERFWTWQKYPGVYLDEDAWAWLLDRRLRIEVALQAGAAPALRKDLEHCMGRLVRYDHIVLRGRGRVAAYKEGTSLTPMGRGRLARTGVLAYLGPDQVGSFSFRERWWLLVWE